QRGRRWLFHGAEMDPRRKGSRASVLELFGNRHRRLNQERMLGECFEGAGARHRYPAGAVLPAAIDKIKLQEPAKSAEEKSQRARPHAARSLLRGHDGALVDVLAQHRREAGKRLVLHMPLRQPPHPDAAEIEWRMQMVRLYPSGATRSHQARVLAPHFAAQGRGGGVAPGQVKTRGSNWLWATPPH